MKFRVLNISSTLLYNRGIANQILQESSLDLGEDVHWATHYIYGTYPNHKLLNGIFKYFFKCLLWFKVRFTLFFMIIMNINKYDKFAIRYSVHDPFLLLLVVLCGRKIITIHHSKELDELSSSGRLGIFRAFLDRYFFYIISARVYGIAAVTSEIWSYEISRTFFTSPHTKLLFPNGVVYSDINKGVSDINLSAHDSSSSPEFIFVASYFYDWQGLDLLLSSIKRSEQKFKLHLVGKVPSDLIETAKKDERICVHGSLDNQQIKIISQRCRVGISALALDRKAMREACTLKSREYLYNGLAVYSGHFDVFPEFESFFRIGPPEVDAILKFHNEIIERKLSKIDIFDKARVYIDKKSIILDFCNILKK